LGARTADGECNTSAPGDDDEAEEEDAEAAFVLGDSEREPVKKSDEPARSLMVVIGLGLSAFTVALISGVGRTNTSSARGAVDWTSLIHSSRYGRTVHLSGDARGGDADAPTPGDAL
jgi:hypothetical protein